MKRLLTMLVLGAALALPTVASASGIGMETYRQLNQYERLAANKQFHLGLETVLQDQYGMKCLGEPGKNRFALCAVYPGQPLVKMRDIWLLPLPKPSVQARS